MIYYIGLVGSGKTTLYRKLNEEKICNAVEIELPQSCKDDEQLKEKLLDLYRSSKDIDAIIVHPYFLPQSFHLEKNDKIVYLDLSFEERIERIQKRSQNIQSQCVIFPKEYLTQEEKYFKKFKEKINDLYLRRA